MTSPARAVYLWGMTRAHSLTECCPCSLQHSAHRLLLLLISQVSCRFPNLQIRANPHLAWTHTWGGHSSEMGATGLCSDSTQAMCDCKQLSCPSVLTGHMAHQQILLYLYRLNEVSQANCLPNTVTAITNTTPKTGG